MAEPMNPVAPVRKTRMRSLLAEGRVVGGDVQGFFAPAVPKAALVHGRDVPPWIRWKHSSRVARARAALAFPRRGPETGGMIGPTSHLYFSQRLRLHYVTWGKEGAPPLLLIHGGRDHCRNW